MNKIESVIKEALKELSNEKMIFQNEREFQFEIGIRLRKYLPNCIVLLESASIYDDKKIYTDIIVIDGGEYYPIELKYKTREGEFKTSYGNVKLSYQGATNLARYDYLYDVYRLEQLKYDSKIKRPDYLKKFKKGFAIMLTNDRRYWEISKDEADRKKCVYGDFCLNDKREIKNGTKLNFKEYENGNGTGKPFINRNTLKFKQNYKCNWNEYYFDSINQFKYLILSI